jgi:hypothetical protein
VQRDSRGQGVGTNGSGTSGYIFLHAQARRPVFPQQNLRPKIIVEAHSIGVLMEIMRHKNLVVLLPKNIV